MTKEHPLLSCARQAPDKPGVYRFRDRRGRDLYVGKARSIRRRVLSYFGRGDLPERTLAMLDRATELDFTVTASEIEAFILENTLIKRLKPRFNVLLRDDKTYPYIKITTGERWPRVLLTRRVRKDGHSYFGPFMGQYMARRLMDLARTRFDVRTCSIEIDGSLPRPCLYFHMGACLGPCVEGLTTAEEYAEAVDRLRMFLSGQYRELLPKLEASMWAAAEHEDYERAARVRDLIAVVERLGERQDVEQPGRGDADVIASYGDGEHATVCVLPYRQGRLVDKREFHFEGVGDVSPADLLNTFIAQYYESNPAVPSTLDLACTLEDEDRALLEQYLGHRRGRRTIVGSPRRGARLRRVELALANARSAFELRFRGARSQAAHLERRLGETLRLETPVRRLECFDISHSAGRETTASCVVWQSGRMEKRQYRTFHIKEVEGIDDYGAIAEAVGRRYRRLRDEQLEMPDAVLIDGGVGQLNAAGAALDTLAVDLPVFALAKREEELWFQDDGEPMRLTPSDPAHQVLRQVRDEAHRFAVSRHRRRRSKRTIATELVNVPGIGPRRATSLIRRFGSVRGIQRASVGELQQALGPRLGAHLWQHLHAGESS